MSHFNFCGAHLIRQITSHSGPALYESLLVFPDTTKFVVTVNMGNDTISIARDEIAAAIENIGWDRIRAFERKQNSFKFCGGRLMIVL